MTLKNSLRATLKDLGNDVFFQPLAEEFFHDMRHDCADTAQYATPCTANVAPRRLNKRCRDTAREVDGRAANPRACEKPRELAARDECDGNSNGRLRCGLRAERQERELPDDADNREGQQGCNRRGDNCDRVRSRADIL
jgi:hypothetical protein